MPDGDISDLHKNRALVDWLRYQLRRAENRVHELEAKALQEQRARERARAEQPFPHAAQPTSPHAITPAPREDRTTGVTRSRPCPYAGPALEVCERHYVVRRADVI
jgi:hypothetical protein